MQGNVGKVLNCVIQPIVWKLGTVFQHHTLYLCHGLLHLCLSESRKCSFQIVHNALKAITLHYLPFMAAQQTEGHLKDHPGPLDKYKI